MEHKAGFVNIIDLILRGECPVDIRDYVYSRAINTTQHYENLNWK